LQLAPVWYLFNLSFVQLLTSDDHGELNIIQNSIMTLFRKDPPGAIMGLFSQVPDRISLTVDPNPTLPKR
jgi:hypothetical protein